MRGQARVSTDPRIEDAFALLYAESYGRIVRYAARRGAELRRGRRAGRASGSRGRPCERASPCTLGWLVGAADSLPASGRPRRRASRAADAVLGQRLSITEIATVTGLSRTAVIAPERPPASRHLSAARRCPAAEPGARGPRRRCRSARGTSCASWSPSRRRLEHAPPRARSSTPVASACVVAVAIVTMIALAPRMAPPTSTACSTSRSTRRPRRSRTRPTRSSAATADGRGRRRPARSTSRPPRRARRRYTFTLRRPRRRTASASSSATSTCFLLADRRTTLPPTPVNSAQGFYAVQDGTAVATPDNTVPLGAGDRSRRSASPESCCGRRAEGERSRHDRPPAPRPPAGRVRLRQPAACCTASAARPWTAATACRSRSRRSPTPSSSGSRSRAPGRSAGRWTGRAGSARRGSSGAGEWGHDGGRPHPWPPPVTSDRLADQPRGQDAGRPRGPHRRRPHRSDGGGRRAAGHRRRARSPAWPRRSPPGARRCCAADDAALDTVGYSTYPNGVGRRGAVPRRRLVDEPGGASTTAPRSPSCGTSTSG